MASNNCNDNLRISQTEEDLVSSVNSDADEINNYVESNNRIRNTEPAENCNDDLRISQTEEDLVFSINSDENIESLENAGSARRIECLENIEFVERSQSDESIEFVESEPEFVPEQNVRAENLSSSQLAQMQLNSFLMSQPHREDGLRQFDKDVEEIQEGKRPTFPKIPQPEYVPQPEEIFEEKPYVCHAFGSRQRIPALTTRRADPNQVQKDFEACYENIEYRDDEIYEATRPRTPEEQRVLNLEAFQKKCGLALVSKHDKSASDIDPNKPPKKLCRQKSLPEEFNAIVDSYDKIRQAKSRIQKIQEAMNLKDPRYNKTKIKGVKQVIPEGSPKIGIGIRVAHCSTSSYLAALSKEKATIPTKTVDSNICAETSPKHDQNHRNSPNNSTMLMSFDEINNEVQPELNKKKVCFRPYKPKINIENEMDLRTAHCEVLKAKSVNRVKKHHAKKYLEASPEDEAVNSTMPIDSNICAEPSTIPDQNCKTSSHYKPKFRNKKNLRGAHSSTSNNLTAISEEEAIILEETSPKRDQNRKNSSPFSPKLQTGNETGLRIAHCSTSNNLAAASEEDARILAETSPKRDRNRKNSSHCSPKTRIETEPNVRVAQCSTSSNLAAAAEEDARFLAEISRKRDQFLKNSSHYASKTRTENETDLRVAHCSTSNNLAAASEEDARILAETSPKRDRNHKNSSHCSPKTRTETEMNVRVAHCSTSNNLAAASEEDARILAETSPKRDRNHKNSSHCSPKTRTETEMNVRVAHCSTSNNLAAASEEDARILAETSPKRDRNHKNSSHCSPKTRTETETNVRVAHCSTSNNLAAASEEDSRILAGTSPKRDQYRKNSSHCSPKNRTGTETDLRVAHCSTSNNLAAATEEDARILAETSPKRDQNRKTSSHCSPRIKTGNEMDLRVAHCSTSNNIAASAEEESIISVDSSISEETSPNPYQNLQNSSHYTTARSGEMHGSRTENEIDLRSAHCSTSNNVAASAEEESIISVDSSIWEETSPNPDQNRQNSSYYTTTRSGGTHQSRTGNEMDLKSAHCSTSNNVAASPEEESIISVDSSISEETSPNPYQNLQNSSHYTTARSGEIHGSRTGNEIDLRSAHCSTSNNVAASAEEESIISVNSSIWEETSLNPDQNRQNSSHYTTARSGETPISSKRATSRRIVYEDPCPYPRPMDTVPSKHGKEVTSPRLEASIPHQIITGPVATPRTSLLNVNKDAQPLNASVYRKFYELKEAFARIAAAKNQANPTNQINNLEVPQNCRIDWEKINNFQPPANSTQLNIHKEDEAVLASTNKKQHRKKSKHRGGKSSSCPFRGPSPPDSLDDAGSSKRRRKRHSSKKPPTYRNQKEKPAKKKDFTLTPEQKALVLDNYYPGLIHDAVNQNTDFNEVAKRFVTPETAVNGDKAEKGMSLIEAFDTRVKYEQVTLKSILTIQPDKTESKNPPYTPVYGPIDHPVLTDYMAEESVRATAIPVDLQHYLRNKPESDPVRAISCLSRAQHLNDYYKEYKAAQAAANLAPPDKVEQAALFGARSFQIESLSSETKTVESQFYKVLELVSYIGVTKPN